MKKIISLLFFAITTFASATDFFVDGTATGANNGTSWANAWTSPLSVTSAVQPGDTVHISGGSAGNSQTYPMSAYWNPPSGTSGNVITYKVGQDASHSGIVIFNYTGGAPASNPWASGTNYAVFSGDAGDGVQHFRLTGYSHGISNTNNSTFEYIDADEGMTEFADFRSGGGNTTGIIVGYCLIKIDDPNASRAIYASTTGATWDAGIRVHHTTFDLLFSDALDGFGVDAMNTESSNGVTMHDCLIRGNIGTYTGGQHQDGWQAKAGTYLKFYNNRFLDVTGYALYGEAFAGNYTDVMVYNNILMTSGSSISGVTGMAGIVFGVNNGSRTFTRVIIANNVVSDFKTKTPIALNNVTGTPATFTDCEIKNNAFVNTTGAIELTGNSTTTPATNASITSGNAPTNFLTYTEYGGISNSYQLLAGAADLIGDATDMSSFFTADYLGVVRTIPWDIGAYKYVPSGQGADLNITTLAITNFVVSP